MNEIAYTACLVLMIFFAGMLAGIGVTMIGFRLGFKASYEIRDADHVESNGLGLYADEDLGPEVELMKEKGQIR